MHSKFVVTVFCSALLCGAIYRTSSMLSKFVLIYKFKLRIYYLIICRPDHNLQDIRAKIFPFRKEKVNNLEVPSVLLPVRIKERSLSSLVVNTPRVASQTGLTGRRTKASRRAAALSGLSPTINESVRKEDDGGVQAKNSNSFETLKTIKNRRQVNKNKS